MKKTKISDFAEVITGGTPSTSIREYWDKGDIPWLQSGACQNKVITECDTFITRQGLDNSTAKMMKPDSVLIALTGATTGKVGYLAFEACANQSVTGIQPNERFVPKYLYYYLRGIRKKILDDSYGGAQKHISQGYVKDIEVPLGTIEEQESIAYTFEKIDLVISFRKKQLELMDDLIKARFVEMFGDYNYPKVSLIDLIAEGAGLPYGIVQPGDDGTGDMGVLRPVDMVDGKISTVSIKYIDRSIGDGFKKTELTGDELLITVRGTTGITALTDKRFVGMNVTRGIAVIRYDRGKINPVYLNTFLNTEESQRYIQEHTRGATLQQINLSDLRAQQIIVPPREQQELFAAFAQQIDKSKVVVKKALDEAQLLFDSLMQKYFG